MLESRAAYGYYGEGYGATGETPKKTHKSGWRIWEFCFDVTNYNDKQNRPDRLLIKACDYAHAIKRAKKWAAENGCTITGDSKGYEDQVNYK